MTYKEACAKACEGCREDWVIVGHTHWGPGDELLDCAAPSRDEHEAGLLARIAELAAEAEFLTTPERLAEIIDAKNARIAELEADQRRLGSLCRSGLVMSQGEAQRPARRLMPP